MVILASILLVIMVLMLVVAAVVDGCNFSFMPEQCVQLLPAWVTTRRVGYIALIMTFIVRIRYLDSESDLAEKARRDRVGCRANPFNASELIPSTIAFTSRYINNDIKRRINYVQSLHPEFEMHFFDDARAELFLKKKCSERHVDIFKTFKNGAHKADFFRYCYLYVNGGFYLDLDNVPLRPLNTLADCFFNVDFLAFLHVGEHSAYRFDLKFNKKQIHNGVMGAKAGSPLLAELIKHVLRHPSPRYVPHQLEYHFYVRFIYKFLLKSMGEKQLFPNTKYVFNDQERIVLRPAGDASIMQVGQRFNDAPYLNFTLPFPTENCSKLSQSDKDYKYITPHAENSSGSRTALPRASRPGQWRFGAEEYNTGRHYNMVRGYNASYHRYFNSKSGPGTAHGPRMLHAPEAQQRGEKSAPKITKNMTRLSLARSTK
jgi:hypothetical protein